jgi:hypothetical protein
MYCVYLTKYNGNKMPKYYVGSSSLKSIEKGYKGSVRSKKYREIWNQELKNNPNLFEIEIISLHENRKEALQKELEYQIENNVVKNENYINSSLARVNGYFGMDVSGNLNPMYGTKRKGEKHNGGENISSSLKQFYATEKGKKSLETKSQKIKGQNNPMYGKKHTEEYKLKMSERMSGKNNPMYGKKHTEEVKRKHSEKMKGENNPACKMRKKYLANDILVENARKFCEENNLTYTNFISYADSGKKYKGFIIQRLNNGEK